MKKYIAPAFEIFDYQVEEGFAASMDLEPGQTVFQIDDEIISGEEFTEYTDNNGDAERGGWDGD